MPTHESLVDCDWENLSAAQKAAFLVAVAQFVADLQAGKVRRGLRVKKMQGHADVWEMTWAPDDRATFSYGTPVKDGQTHVVWRRIGTHDIFNCP